MALLKIKSCIATESCRERRFTVYTPQVHETSRPLEPTNEDTFGVMDRLVDEDEIPKALLPGLVSKDQLNPTERLL